MCIRDSLTSNAFTGPLTGNVTGNLTGNVTGNVTGNITGNVTGNVSGSAGSCTGNSATATTATNLSGGSVSATTGNFSGAVSSPSFVGPLTGNVTGNVSGLAGKASTLAAGGGAGSAMTFNWSGQGGQPTWVWGGNDGASMFVYNPGNFNVNSALTANYATGAGTATNLYGGSITFGDGSTLSTAPLGSSAQSWQIVTSYRALGGTYTNSTGRAIFVMVTCYGYGLAAIYVNGSQIAYPQVPQANYDNMAWSFIVPNGANYSVSANGLVTWSELR